MNRHFPLIAAIALVFNLSAQDFEWAKSFGGTAETWGQAIATDDSGHVYMAGLFRGVVDFDPGVGVFNMTAPSGAFVFVVKLTATGDLVWAKCIGGGTISEPEIVVDNNRNVLIYGDFRNTCDFDPGSSTFNITSIGASDIYLCKLNSKGQFIWAKTYGSSTWDYGEALDVDKGGNIYITGRYNGAAIVGKVDSLGNSLWIKEIGGTGYEISVDNLGNVITAGKYTGTEDFDPGISNFTLTSVGSYDIFISKLDSSGSFVWAKSVGGMNADYVTGIQVNDLGEIYFAGYITTGSSDFDPGLGVSNISAGTGVLFESYIVKFDAAGSLMWARQTTSQSSTNIRSLNLDKWGNVYATGDFYSTTDFNPNSGTSNLTSPYGIDFFTFKWSGNGDFLWAKCVVSPNRHNYSYSIAVNDFGGVYLAGKFGGICDFDPDTSTFNLTSSANYDAFVLKLSSCKPILSYQNITSCQSFTTSGSKILTSSGLYTDSLKTTYGCDSLVVINLTINKVDTGVIQTGATLVSKADSASYEWFDCSTNNSIFFSSNNGVFSPAANGIYKVVVLRKGCKDTSACYAINNVGFSESGFIEKLHLFPNPTSGEVYLTGHVDNSKIKIQVFNSQGYLLGYQGLEDGHNSIIKLQGPSGLYFLHVENDSGEKRIFKVVKE